MPSRQRRPVFHLAGTGDVVLVVLTRADTPTPQRHWIFSWESLEASHSAGPWWSDATARPGYAMTTTTTSLQVFYVTLALYSTPYRSCTFASHSAPSEASDCAKTPTLCQLQQQSAAAKIGPRGRRLTTEIEIVRRHLLEIWSRQLTRRWHWTHRRIYGVNFSLYGSN